MPVFPAGTCRRLVSLDHPPVHDLLQLEPQVHRPGTPLEAWMGSSFPWGESIRRWKPPGRRNAGGRLQESVDGFGRGNRGAKRGGSEGAR
jgi:hypothetical protein